MNDHGPPGGISYSPKEMYQRLEQALHESQINVDFLVRQVHGERAAVDQRIAKIEQRMLVYDEYIAKADQFHKMFVGFETRFGQHDASETHPSAASTWAVLKADLEARKINEHTQGRLTEYIKESQAERRDANERAAVFQRWLIGLSIPVAVTLGLALARTFGWVP